MVDTTSSYIPKWLKTEALDLYGRGRCPLCGSSRKREFAHIGVDKDDDPYKDTQAHNLPPLCISCHRKADWGGYVASDEWGGLLVITLNWLVRTKAGLIEKELTEYLDDMVEDLKENAYVPLGGEKEFVRDNVNMPEHFKMRLNQYFEGEDDGDE